MKKISLVFLVILFFSCQNNKQTEKKDTKSAEKETGKTQWIFDEDHSLIQWTAYKTTGKVPVRGEFKQFDIKGVKPAPDMPSALKNVEIDVNIFSVFTSEEKRDKRIIQYLFEKMKNTSKIHIKVTRMEPDKIYADITMNGVAKEIPFDIKTDEKRGILSLTSKIDLVKDFQAEKPLRLLNKACYKLHMGEDGISKTWPEVSLGAFFKFHKK